MNIIVTKRFSCNKSNITAGKPTVVFRRCNNKVCNFGLMNEQSWRQIWPYLAIPQQFPWSSRWREWPQTTAWVSGDASLFWRRRRDNIHTPPNAHHQRPLSPRGPAVAAGRGFSWFSGSWGLRWIFVIWQKNQLGLNYGESFHAYAMSSNISQLKLSYIVRIDIEISSVFIRWICQNRISRTCIQDYTLWNYLQLSMDIKLHTNTQKRSEQKQRNCFIFTSAQWQLWL